MAQPTPSPQLVPKITVTATTTPSQPIKKKETETLAEAVHRLALKYNVDETIATKIIYCESGNNPQARHYNENKTIDYSYFQINSIWKEAMAKKGWDITNSQQNLEAGFYLLATEGIGPWRYSSDCQKGTSKTPLYR